MTISGTIDQLGNEFTDWGIFATDSFTLSSTGRIHHIIANSCGIFSQKLGITIDGIIGDISISGTLRSNQGILSQGFITINNAVGPITVAGTNYSIAVEARNGITLGDGIELLSPAGATLGSPGELFCIMDKNGEPSAKAQFGRPAPTTAPTVPVVPDVPATGDGMNLPLLTAMAMLSLLGVTLLWRKARRCS